MRKLILMSASVAALLAAVPAQASAGQYLGSGEACRVAENTVRERAGVTRVLNCYTLRVRHVSQGYRANRQYAYVEHLRRGARYHWISEVRVTEYATRYVTRAGTSAAMTARY